MGEVYHYRDFTKAAQRWSNMERVRLLEQMIFTEDELRDLLAVALVDTAPSEWSPPESDSA